MAYGKEMLLDLYGCDVSRFTRKGIKEWLVELCKLINMSRADLHLHYWDYIGYEGGAREKIEAPIHLCGTSGIQFITTSNITIHTLDSVGECMINIFSCRNFSSFDAACFTADWFGASRKEERTIERGKESHCKSYDLPETEECYACRFHSRCSGPSHQKVNSIEDEPCQRFDDEIEYNKKVDEQIEQAIEEDKKSG